MLLSKMFSAAFGERLWGFLELVLKAEIIPAENEIQCGNYRLHNLNLAKAYAQKVLDEGINDKVFA